VGVLFFKETLDWKQWSGALLAIVGIYLMSGSK
jgi:drug/metabolite transporter (DMT)-like permease